MLISAEYLKQNKILHERSVEFGASGFRWVDEVVRLVTEHKFETVLDYGAGKGLLRKGVMSRLPNLTFQNYDPAIPRWSADPKPADLLVCTDVVEHIEPERLQDVLDHMARLTLSYCLITGATRPATKKLPDGRNAHLIQENFAWWLEQLSSRFVMEKFSTDTSIQEFHFYGSPGMGGGQPVSK